MCVNAASKGHHYKDVKLISLWITQVLVNVKSKDWEETLYMECLHCSFISPLNPG